MRKLMASLALLLVFNSHLCASTPAFMPSIQGADTPIGAKTMARMNSIIIDKCNLARLDLSFIAPWLTRRSKELDPSHIGVKIVLEGPYQAPPPGQGNREYTFNLEDAPLREVLDYLCALSGYRMRIEGDRVVLFRPTK